DVERPGEVARIGVLERGQAREVGRAVEQAVEAAEPGADAPGELLVVAVAGAREVEGIVDRLGQPGRVPRDGVVDAVELGHLAPQQYHRGPGTRAGHRRGRAEATVGPGHQHHAPGQRGGRACGGRGRAHAFCVSATMRASSPDSNSSMVMSQPPISSPLMNSCGKVGQLETRGRLARTSGSSSTLMVCRRAMSAPASRSAATVRLEKPHIGNWGVPFMKRTMGWPAMSAWMRSMMAMSAPDVAPGGGPRGTGG